MSTFQRERYANEPSIVLRAVADDRSVTVCAFRGSGTVLLSFDAPGTSFTRHLPAGEARALAAELIAAADAIEAAQ